MNFVDFHLKRIRTQNLKKSDILIADENAENESTSLNCIDHTTTDASINKQKNDYARQRDQLGQIKMTIFLFLVILISTVCIILMNVLISRHYLANKRMTSQASGQILPIEVADELRYNSSYSGRFSALENGHNRNSIGVAPCLIYILLATAANQIS
jgi:hypothetical protein